MSDSPWHLSFVLLFRFVRRRRIPPRDPLTSLLCRGRCHPFAFPAPPPGIGRGRFSNCSRHCHLRRSVLAGRRIDHRTLHKASVRRSFVLSFTSSSSSALFGSCRAILLFRFVKPFQRGSSAASKDTGLSSISSSPPSRSPSFIRPPIRHPPPPHHHHNGPDRTPTSPPPSHPPPRRPTNVPRHRLT